MEGTITEEVHPTEEETPTGGELVHPPAGEVVCKGEAAHAPPY